LSDVQGFRWHDGERIIRFGRGALADAPRLLGDGYTLLTTQRAATAAPALEEPAAVVLHVDPGRVDELAAQLRPHVQGELLVALGGGRVVDVAKALAAADPPRRVAAIPTTLSAAEMTRVHRHATGIPPETPRVRAHIVINDPALSASQPAGELAASAANSMGHAYEGPVTTLTNPVAQLVGREAARLLSGAWKEEEPDRDALALGALLSGYAIDNAGYGLHHVLSQTLVRYGGASHGQANAAMLPHTTRALEQRFPDGIAALRDALGEDPFAVAMDFAERASALRLRDIGVAEEALPACVEQAAARPELHMTPPVADANEIAALYRAAW
jgi:alcohol dehydrogenase class IV